MRRILGSLIAVLALVVVCVLPFAGMQASSSSPEKPDTTVSVLEPGDGVVNKAVNCQIINNPKTIRIICKVANVTVLNQVVPLPDIPTVTLPVPPAVTEIVRLPGKTVTIRPPPVTQTVPGDTRTVREPGPTVTRTAPTETETVTATTGQTDSPDDTMESNDPEDRVDLSDDNITAEEVGIGLLALLGFVAIVLLAMWAGYSLGYKEADQENASFMEVLLDRSKIRRGKHS